MELVSEGKAFRRDFHDAPSMGGANSSSACLAACLRKPWSLKTMKAVAPSFDMVIASLRSGDSMMTGMPAFRAAAMMGSTILWVSGEVIDGAPMAAVRSPRPMKKASIPSTAAMASILIQRGYVFDDRDAGPPENLGSDAIGKGNSRQAGPALVVLAKRPLPPRYRQADAMSRAFAALAT